LKRGCGWKEKNKVIKQMDFRLPMTNQGGEIQMIMGPMFSGKTTELLRRLRRYQIAQQKCLVIKYAGDDRYDPNELTTHDQAKHAATCVVRRLEHVQWSDYTVIGIDECQMFPDLVAFCDAAANAGCIVIAAGLDGSFQRRPFPNVMELIAISESVTKLSAVCMKCHSSAAFTKRLTKETELQVIGGADKYMACCRWCYNH
jgi:thymidine kinase